MLLICKVGFRDHSYHAACTEITCNFRYLLSSKFAYLIILLWFQYINPAYERLFGYTSEEIMGQDLNELPQSERNKADTIETIKSSVKKGKVSIPVANQFSSMIYYTQDKFYMSSTIKLQIMICGSDISICIHGNMFLMKVFTNFSIKDLFVELQTVLRKSPHGSKSTACVFRPIVTVVLPMFTT